MVEDNEGGRRLRHLRGVRQWTRAQLAERSGVSESSISNYEMGKTLPDPEKILPIAEAFEKDGAWLLEGFGFVEDAQMMAARHSGDPTEAITEFRDMIDRWLKDREV